MPAPKDKSRLEYKVQRSKQSTRHSVVADVQSSLFGPFAATGSSDYVSTSFRPSPPQTRRREFALIRAPTQHKLYQFMLPGTEVADELNIIPQWKIFELFRVQWLLTCPSPGRPPTTRGRRFVYDGLGATPQLKHGSGSLRNLPQRLHWPTVSTTMAFRALLPNKSTVKNAVTRRWKAISDRPGR